jgi:hypothetical protein
MVLVELLVDLLKGMLGIFGIIMIKMTVCRITVLIGYGACVV